ncbi:MAG: precorrin-6y C5,15-methyltransferase (decarboxylating) subunit CbiE [Clostridiales bacterium]|nr:precorrin-6y C5,15-methyltransferase (decarboxylating) subunit CbiE [Clostridiales bacterium]
MSKVQELSVGRRNRKCKGSSGMVQLKMEMKADQNRRERNMSQLTIVGIGPGSADYFMPAARNCMRDAHTVIAAKRILPMLQEVCGDTDAEFCPMGKIQDTFIKIDTLLREDRSVALVVSGDPLMYSLYKTILNDDISKDWEIAVIPGIGSMQMLGAAFGETMEDALLVSVHGRSHSPGMVALWVTEHPKVFFLCSKEQGPAWLSQIMLDYHLDDVEVYVGANLSYEEQELTTGSPADMVRKEFPSLCVAMIKNPHPKPVMRPCFLSDEDFERGKTPMTKEEIRVLILHKMKIHPDDILWDIGAGTGSISIECARQAPFGEVYSVEREDAAVELIRKNKEKFGVGNLKIYHGDAAQQAKKLPVPTKVFIGGSGGKLREILEVIAAFHKNIPVTVTAVTLETISEAGELLGGYDSDYDVIQATIGRGRKIGSYHIMDTNNPVMIFTAVI